VDAHLACSDLCEENGFTRQAELLRSFHRNGGKAYVIFERSAAYNDEIYSPQKAGEPSTIYLDEATARKVAAERNTEWYRNNNILDYCDNLNQVTNLSAAELFEKIAAIVGREHELPNGGFPTFARTEDPLIPGTVTDEQMQQIADLFTLKFYYVVETEFAPADRSSIES